MPEDKLSTTLLCLPAVAPPCAGEFYDSEQDAAAWERFIAFTDLVSKSALLCAADKVCNVAELGHCCPPLAANPNFYLSMSYACTAS